MHEGLSALSMQVGMAIGHIRAQQRELDDLRMWRRRTEQRLKALETPQDRPRLAGLIREIATPREWATALVVALLALWGIVTPEEIRDKVRSALDLPPIIRHGPG